MTPIPALPSDSLYKFLFAGGIIIMIFCRYQISEKRTELNGLDIRSDSLLTVLTIQSEKDSIEQKRAIDFLRAKIQYLEDNRSKDLTSHDLDSIYSLGSNYIRYKIENAGRKRESIKIRTQISDMRDDILQIVLLMIFGAILTAISGCFWYIRVQRYQDKILELQYLELKTLQNRPKSSTRIHHEPKILPRKQHQQ